MENLLIITGPTGIGKTELSLKLAKKYKGEIISSDSMQIYKKLDIGTAKVDLENTEIPHHMVDIIDAKENFSVAEFKQRAKEIISEINSRGGLPLVVGGTGLYINSLVYNLDFTEIEAEDGERLLRAIARERQQKTPQYEEMCRRFLADAADFSEEKLTEAGITRRFINNDMEGTIREITEYIRQDMSGTKKQG